MPICYNHHPVWAQVEHDQWEDKKARNELNRSAIAGKHPELADINRRIRDRRSLLGRYDRGCLLCNGLHPNDIGHDMIKSLVTR